jgi:hypothetical protein
VANNTANKFLGTSKLGNTISINAKNMNLASCPLI